MRCKLAFVVFGLVSAGFVVASSSFADDGALGRIAIIDASVNTKPFLDVLHKAGVKVIGRYYARCDQNELKDGAGVPLLKEKRMIDNGDEVAAILSHEAGFAILSIYQYYNNSPNKFFGKGVNPRTGKALILKDEKCEKPANPPHTAEQEAELDAIAAVTQAQLVRQPRGTAIYFGADFNSGGMTAEQKAAMVTYFKKVKAVLASKDYLLGAYGDGENLELLRNTIDFAWLSSSPGYTGAIGFYNSGKWDFFQNTADLKWKTDAGVFELDTSVQNAATAGKYIGFWNSKGPYMIPPERTLAVFNQHRFVCNGAARVYRLPQATPANMDRSGRCKRIHFEVSRSTRIGARNGDFIQIDCDEDGTFDGWTRVDSLSDSFALRPTYERHKERKAELCR